MTALTELTTRLVQGASRLQYAVTDTEEVFMGGTVSLDTSTGNENRVKAFTGGADEIPLGFAQPGDTTLSADGSVTGNTAGTNNVTVELLESVLPDITVAGTTGAVDVGRTVYELDDQDYTTVANGLPAGTLARHLTGTRFDLHLFSAAQRNTLALSGAAAGATILVASLDATSLTGNLLAGYILQGNGRITSTFAIVDVIIAGAGGDMDVNLEIGGANVTGGVIPVLTAGGTRAANLPGSAITALGAFSDGDLLDVEGVENVAITSGRINLYIVVEYDAGS